MNYLTAIALTVFLGCTAVVSRALPVSRRPGEPLNPTTCTLNIREHSSMNHPSSLRMRAVCEPQNDCEAVVRRDSNDETYSVVCVRREEVSGYTAPSSTLLSENELLNSRMRPQVSVTGNASPANQRKGPSSQIRPQVILTSGETNAETTGNIRRPYEDVTKREVEEEGEHDGYSSDVSKSKIRRSRPFEYVNPTTGSASSNEETTEAEQRRPFEYINPPAERALTGGKTERRPFVYVTDEEVSTEGANVENSSDESKLMMKRSRPFEYVNQPTDNAETSADSSRVNRRPFELVSNSAEPEQDADEQPRQERPMEFVSDQAQSSERKASRRSAHSNRPTEYVGPRGHHQHPHNRRSNVQTRRPYVNVRNGAQANPGGHKRTPQRGPVRRPSEYVN